MTACIAAPGPEHSSQPHWRSPTPPFPGDVGCRPAGGDSSPARGSNRLITGANLYSLVPLLLVTPLAAQSSSQSIEVDLRRLYDSVKVHADRYSVTLTNRLPQSGISYSIKTERSRQVIPPLDLGQAGNAQTFAERQGCPVDTNVTDEGAVPGLLRQLERQEGCQEEAEAARHLSRDPLGEFAIDRGERLVLVVERQGGGLDAKTWRFVLDGPERRTWELQYGFTFLREDDEAFFLDPIQVPMGDGDGNGGGNGGSGEMGNGEGGGGDAEETRFLIERQEDRKAWDFFPSVLFVWPALGPEDLAFGPVAGVGYDLSDVTVSFGLGVRFMRNVTVTGGVAFHSSDRLAGQHMVGDTLMDTRTSDELVESSFRPRAFVGLALRLGDNPFGASKDKDEPEINPGDQQGTGGTGGGEQDAGGTGDDQGGAGDTGTSETPDEPPPSDPAVVVRKALDDACAERAGPWEVSTDGNVVNIRAPGDPDNVVEEIPVELTRGEENAEALAEKIRSACGSDPASTS